MMKKTAYLFAIGILFAFALLSCSNDDDDNDNGPSVAYGATFTISGAINGEKTGTAAVVNSESGGSNVMNISIHDGVDGPQSYSLSFFMGPSTEQIEIPSVGTYTIGSIGKEETDFWMVYTNTATGEEYGSHGEQLGALTIEESTNTYIKGKFQFNARELLAMGDPSDSKQITVENGEFTARINQ